MGTFSDQAQAKAEELEFLMLQLREDITKSKASVLDAEAMAVLTRLQARMLIIRTDLQQFRSATSAAIQCREFQDRDPDTRLALRYPHDLYPDRQSAAAHDATLFPTTE